MHLGVLCPRKKTKNLKSICIKQQRTFIFIWDTKEGKTFGVGQTGNRLVLNAIQADLLMFFAYQKKILSPLEENAPVRALIMFSNSMSRSQ